MCVLACRQKVNGRRHTVHEPELDYGIESDEDWEEPADGELLTVCTIMPDAHLTCLVSVMLPSFVHAPVPRFPGLQREDCNSFCIAQAVQQLLIRQCQFSKHEGALPSSYIAVQLHEFNAIPHYGSAFTAVSFKQTTCMHCFCQRPSIT